MRLPRTRTRAPPTPTRNAASLSCCVICASASGVCIRHSPEASPRAKTVRDFLRPCGAQPRPWSGRAWVSASHTESRSGPRPVTPGTKPERRVPPDRRKGEPTRWRPASSSLAYGESHEVLWLVLTSQTPCIDGIGTKHGTENTNSAGDRYPVTPNPHFCWSNGIQEWTADRLGKRADTGRRNHPLLHTVSLGALQIPSMRQLQLRAIVVWRSL